MADPDEEIYFNHSLLRYRVARGVSEPQLGKLCFGYTMKAIENMQTSEKRVEAMRALVDRLNAGLMREYTSVGGITNE